MRTPPPPSYQGRSTPSRLRTLLVMLGVFLVVVFAVDKLMLTAPSGERQQNDLLAQIQRHEIRRATIAVRSITVELNDGRTLTERVPRDRDVGPPLKASGADIAIARPAANDEPSQC